MARTPSTMVPLGTMLPDFSLPDGHGMQHDMHAVQGDVGTLVIFMCNHCPFVVHIAAELAALGRDYTPQGIGIVGINSNDVESYPDDAPEHMVVFAETHGIHWPYLYDASQDVALAFEAACTPDFFLYNNNQELVYRGQLDDSRPGNDKPVTGADLRAALDALVRGESISSSQQPSLGCNIKWKATSDHCLRGESTS